MMRSFTFTCLSCVPLGGEQTWGSLPAHHAILFWFTHRDSIFLLITLCFLVYVNYPCPSHLFFAWNDDSVCTAYILIIALSGKIRNCFRSLEEHMSESIIFMTHKHEGLRGSRRSLVSVRHASISGCPREKVEWYCQGDTSYARWCACK